MDSPCAGKEPPKERGTIVVVIVRSIPKSALCIEENLKETLHDAHDLRHGIHYYGGKSFTLERFLKDVGHTWHMNQG